MFELPIISIAMSNQKLKPLSVEEFSIKTEGKDKFKYLIIRCRISSLKFLLSMIGTGVTAGIMKVIGLI